MGVDLYTSFQNLHGFWLKKCSQLIHETTYTQENTVLAFECHLF